MTRLAQAALFFSLFLISQFAIAQGQANIPEFAGAGSVPVEIQFMKRVSEHGYEGIELPNRAVKACSSEASKRVQAARSRFPADSPAFTRLPARSILIMLIDEREGRITDKRTVANVENENKTQGLDYYVSGKLDRAGNCVLPSIDEIAASYERLAQAVAVGKTDNDVLRELAALNALHREQAPPGPKSPQSDSSSVKQPI